MSAIRMCLPVNCTAGLHIILHLLSLWTLQIVGDSLAMYLVVSSTGTKDCFQVSSNERRHDDTNRNGRCASPTSLAWFDSVQQFDQIGTVLDPSVVYHVAVELEQGVYKWKPSDISVDTGMWDLATVPSDSGMDCGALGKTSQPDQFRLEGIQCSENKFYICRGVGDAQCGSGAQVIPYPSNPAATTTVRQSETTQATTNPPTHPPRTTEPNPLTTPETPTVPTEAAAVTTQPSPSTQETATTEAAADTSLAITSPEEATATQPTAASQESVTVVTTSIPITSAETSAAQPTAASQESVTVATSLPAVSSLPLSSTSTCQCNCQAANSGANVTASELAGKVETIKAELTIEADTLSAQVRKKTSAEDHRTSATVTGYVGIVFMVVAFSVPVLLDLSRVLAYITSCRAERGDTVDESGGTADETAVEDFSVEDADADC